MFNLLKNSLRIEAFSKATFQQQIQYANKKWKLSYRVISYNQYIQDKLFILINTKKLKGVLDGKIISVLGEKFSD